MPDLFEPLELNAIREVISDALHDAEHLRDNVGEYSNKAKELKGFVRDDAKGIAEQLAAAEERLFQWMIANQLLTIG